MSLASGPYAVDSIRKARKNMASVLADTVTCLPRKRTKSMPTQKPGMPRDGHVGKESHTVCARRVHARVFQAERSSSARARDSVLVWMR